MFKLNLRRRLYLLPIITALFCVLSFCVTYVVAASLGHVELAFPYISYTGLKTPERGIFGQLLNIGALLLGMNAFFRYLRLQKVAAVPVKLNKAGLYLGLISAFGMSMVANFETKVMRAPHYIGAFLGFGLAGVYCWLHTVISWKRRSAPESRPRFTFLYQLIICCTLTFFTIVFIVSKIIYKSYDNEEERRMDPGPVRTAYLTSTSSEWCLAVSLMAYLLSFVSDFRNVEIRGPEIIVTCDNVDALREVTDKLTVGVEDDTTGLPDDLDMEKLEHHNHGNHVNGDTARCSLIHETTDTENSVV